MASTILGSALVLGACGNSSEEPSANESTETSSQTAGEESAQVEGSVSGDGSSTVAPIMEGIVEEYAGAQPNVQVTVGVSGTGGGFEKFIQGETAFSNASRLEFEKDKAVNVSRELAYRLTFTALPFSNSNADSFTCSCSSNF